jgi:hypothetical protein
MATQLSREQMRNAGYRGGDEGRKFFVFGQWEYQKAQALKDQGKKVFILRRCNVCTQPLYGDNLEEVEQFYCEDCRQKYSIK